MNVIPDAFAQGSGSPHPVAAEQNPNIEATTPGGSVSGVDAAATAPDPSPFPPFLHALREIYAIACDLGGQVTGLAVHVSALPDDMAAEVADVLLPVVEAVRNLGAQLAVRMTIEQVAHQLGADVRAVNDVADIIQAFKEKPHLQLAPNAPVPVQCNMDAPRCYFCERRQPAVDAATCYNCGTAEPCKPNPLLRRQTS